MRLPFTAPAPREGMPAPKLPRGEFLARFRSQLPGPAFDGLGAELDRVAEAASHEALDRDEAVQEEVRSAARALVAQVALGRGGRLPDPQAGLREPRPK